MVCSTVECRANRCITLAETPARPNRDKNVCRNARKSACWPSESRYDRKSDLSATVRFCVVWKHDSLVSRSDAQSNCMNRLACLYAAHFPGQSFASGSIPTSQALRSVTKSAVYGRVSPVDTIDRTSSFRGILHVCPSRFPTGKSTSGRMELRNSFWHTTIEIPSFTFWQCTVGNISPGME